MKEYELYKGEELLAIGTIAYIARVTGVKRETIAFYKTPTYKNRLEKRNAKNPRILISLDDEGEENHDTKRN